MTDLRTPVSAGNRSTIVAEHVHELSVISLGERRTTNNGGRDRLDISSSAHEFKRRPQLPPAPCAHLTIPHRFPSQSCSGTSTLTAIYASRIPPLLNKTKF